MPYITRDDGEHFVIPSYRDVMPAKNKSVLKRDILLLSQSYGEYITMQRKNADEYEVAFSAEIGYLLGESVWHYFKRPDDLIYCEAIPDTTEAILVIVKSGAVYLDGTFSFDSIPEELVVFLTQKNNFEIYIYGDVPISQIPQVGKFAFDATSVKSFNVLEAPVFQTLPLLKIYQFRLVDTVLKSHGIGVFPIRQIVVGGVVLGLLWMVYSYLTAQPQIVQQILTQQNPYQPFYDALSSPDPYQEINQLMPRIELLYSIPGWMPHSITYSNGSMAALVKSNGSTIQMLSSWAEANRASVDVRSDGIYVVINFPVARRFPPRKIYNLNDVMGKFIDNLAAVYPGNRLQMGSITNKGLYKTISFVITLDNISPAMLVLIGAQFKNLPFVMKQVLLTMKENSISGSITINALGN